MLFRQAKVVLDNLNRFRKIILAERAAFINNEVDALRSCWEEIVLQRRRSEVCIHNRAGLALYFDDPLTEFARVWNRSRKKDVLDRSRKQDDGFFPDYTTLFVAHVMNLIEDDPGHLTGHLTAVVEHAPQDLCRHDQARCSLINRHITGHEADIFKLLLKLSVFLVAKCFDWGRVDDSLLGFERLRDGVLCNSCLTGRSMRSNEDRLIFLNAVDCPVLELIKGEGILLRLDLWPLEVLLSIVTARVDRLMDAVFKLDSSDFKVVRVVAKFANTSYLSGSFTILSLNIFSLLLLLSLNFSKDAGSLSS